MVWNLYLQYDARKPAQLFLKKLSRFDREIAFLDNVHNNSLM